MKKLPAHYQSIVKLGKIIFADTAFTDPNKTLSEHDLVRFEEFLSKEGAQSAAWNSKAKTHIQLARAIAKKLVKQLAFNPHDKLLTVYQVISHDVGRLITHEVITSERIGWQLLKDFGFIDYFISIHFGWDYYISVEFSPLLRSERDRVVLLADLFGKSGSNHGVRSVEEIVETIQALKIDYQYDAPPIFFQTVDVAVNNCIEAMNACLDWLAQKGVNFQQILVEIGAKKIAK